MIELLNLLEKKYLKVTMQIETRIIVVLDKCQDIMIQSLITYENDYYTVDSYSVFSNECVCQNGAGNVNHVIGAISQGHEDILLLILTKRGVK